MNALAPPPHVHQVTTIDGTVLLDTGRGRFYGLNPTGSIIWKALSNGHSVEQITRDLTARYAAPPDRVRADITTLVAQLRDRGLLDTTTG
ncbi:MAG: lasso peptide biosynthesis PqqD family chaperone [Sciscionella sp.]